MPKKCLDWALFNKMEYYELNKTLFPSDIKSSHALQQSNETHVGEKDEDIFILSDDDEAFTD